ncbi:unnamed protein product [Fraxinus pennsylvanica]|uniref:DUF7950 domain-containing protein n=1 Tax=Fraxinus pennsylvanica TaxID=56036 RepID=A0AAD1YMP8_9LAMI|nr:unnamed protein product [Fraxinus pennsylvanica]
MDGRGGCCIARYTGGGVYDMSKFGRIMMRFRPIAPKPASTNGSVSGGSNSTPENADPSVKTGRGKRKYAKDAASAKNKNKKVCNRKRKASPENSASGGSVSGGETVVTLPLFPQTSDVKGSMKRDAPSAPLLLSFGSEGGENLATVVGSWVTVECVTNSLMDCYRLGRTDKERVMSLQRDTCPGFISDSLNRVMWTNGTYRQMVSGTEEEVVACLVIKAGVVVPAGVPSFTCRVRVATCGKDKISLTLPCDVWRMECGGFAWRLDTTAALSLGR